MGANLFTDLMPRRSAASGLRAVPASLVAHGLALGAVALFAARPVAVEMPEPAPLHAGPLKVDMRDNRPAPQILRAAVAPPRPRLNGLTAPAPIAPPPGPAPDLSGNSTALPSDDAPAACLRNCDGAGPGDGSGTPGSFLTPLGDPNGSGDASRTYQVGGDIRPPQKIREAAPVYPELAKHAHVQGAVVVRCVIDATGHVANVEVVSGHPMLAEAAVAAVRQWLYKPTLLNGTPVAVEMLVTLQFHLR